MKNVLFLLITEQSLPIHGLDQSFFFVQTAFKHGKNYLIALQSSSTFSIHWSHKEQILSRNYFSLSVGLA